MRLRSGGFTLLEIMLSLSIFMIIVAIMAPIISNSQQETFVLDATQTVVTGMRRAQILARSGQPATPWGVRVQTGSVIVFQGATYATRNASLDETLSFNSNTAASGTVDYISTWDDGLTNTAGSTTLTSNQQTKTITVNSFGMIDY